MGAFDRFWNWFAGQPSTPPAKVFLSHACRNDEVAHAIASQAQALNQDVKVYLAENDVQLGESIDQKLTESLLSTDAMVLLLTEEAKQSKKVQWEVEFARHHGIPIAVLKDRSVDYPSEFGDQEYVAWQTFDPQTWFDDGCDYAPCLTYGESLSEEGAIADAVADFARRCRNRRRPPN